MILVEKIQGNIKDDHWQKKLGSLKQDFLRLEQWEAPKSRLRKSSEQGHELAISLPRNERLHDGDVLYYDETNNVVVIARIALKDVLVIELQNFEKLSHQEILSTCFELGHGLGNQHWPAVIKGTTVYVPLSVDQKVMASVMRTHAYPNIKTSFASGEEVAQKLDASEVRLLFAGADATPHHHRDKAEHAHKHEHEHEHEHAHDHDHDHDHEHPNGHEHSHTHQH